MTILKFVDFAPKTSSPANQFNGEGNYTIGEKGIVVLRRGERYVLVADRRMWLLFDNLKAVEEVLRDHVDANRVLTFPCGTYRKLKTLAQYDYLQPIINEGSGAVPVKFSETAVASVFWSSQFDPSTD